MLTGSHTVGHVRTILMLPNNRKRQTCTFEHLLSRHSMSPAPLLSPLRSYLDCNITHPLPPELFVFPDLRPFPRNTPVTAPKHFTTSSSLPHIPRFRHDIQYPDLSRLFSSSVLSSFCSSTDSETSQLAEDAVYTTQRPRDEQTQEAKDPQTHEQRTVFALKRKDAL